MFILKGNLYKTFPTHETLPHHFLLNANLPGICATNPETENIFIITIDGVRWQELFNGADSVLINNATFTTDTSLAKQIFWDESTLESRKKLTPFFWNVIEKRGQLYGNRFYKNKVSVANFYKFSYPGL